MTMMTNTMTKLPTIDHKPSFNKIPISGLISLLDVECKKALIRNKSETANTPMKITREMVRKEPDLRNVILRFSHAMIILVFLNAH